jgi:5-formyltetrahydrofolate cyclo-ligase
VGKGGDLEGQSRLAQWPCGSGPRGRQAGVHGRAPPGRGRRSSCSTRPTHDIGPHASSIKGASRSAITIDLDQLTPVDLVIAAASPSRRTVARLGKGGGFSDLELAVAATAGLVDTHTVVATTVHDRQVLEAGRIRRRRTTSTSI